MSNSAYRLQVETGLSEEFTLQMLREKKDLGQVSGTTHCTSDDGATWVSLSKLIAEPEAARDSASSADDTTARASSETASENFGGPRKLKRLPVNSGKSRFSKATTERTKQKIGEKKKELSDLVGRTLPGGRYKVLSQFGSGSMAYVFRASDNRLQTDVIIKIPKPEKITSDDFRERFRRESQLLVRLSHPHVVKVLDVGEFDDLPYVVMQLLSGGTLLDVMKNDSNDLNQMDPKSLRTWVREVARALDFCFKKGMVHRDVKPANILFDDDHNAYVSDFGLTKIMHGEHTELCSDGTANGVVLGTPNYLPPEIILGAKYDGRADQYSLAMTVYHALCGRPPMQGKSATATMINQTQKKLELLSSFRPDIPVEVALVVQKGIEKNPRNRFENSEAFADALLEGLKSDSSSSSKVASPAKTSPAAAVAASVDSGQWYEESDASSPRSSARRRPKKKKPTGKRKSSSASSAVRSRQKNDDWLEPAPAKLPPKRGAKSKAMARRKPPKAGKIVVFGQEIHPVALAVTAVVTLLPTVLFLIYWFTRNDDTGFTNASVAAVSQSQTQTERAKQGAGRRNSPSDKLQNGGGQDESVASPVGDSASPDPVDQSMASATAIAKNRGYSSGIQGATPALAMSEPMASNDMSGEPVESPDSSAMEPSETVTGAESDPLVLSSVSTAKVTRGAPNCPVVVVGLDVWSCIDRSKVMSLEGEYDATAQTALSPDGRYFCAASKPPGQQNTDVVVWNVETGKPQFTAAGDSKRFVDSILLSQDRLYVGDRWSDELFVWDCESGKKKQSVKIAQARYKQGNTAISHNGQFIAAVTRNQLSVFDAASAKGIVTLANPRAAARGADKAEALYASLQSLSFSPDNSEIASVSTVNGSRFLCWNGQGELVFERVMTGSLANNPTVQWFANHKAWLVGSDILDRDTERALLSVVGQSSDTVIQIFDDTSLCGRFTTNPSQVSIRDIPWDAISRSLLAMKNDRESAIRPGVGVSLNLQLKGASGKYDADLRKAVRARLTASGLSVSESGDVRLTLRLTAPDEQFLPNVASQQPSDGRLSGAAETQAGNLLVVELRKPGAIEPVWSTSLGDVSKLMRDSGASPVERQELVRLLTSEIDSLAIPYYVPDSFELIALPVVLR